MDVSKLNELLECSVCLNTLDISSKVLPCQHTFCKKCLQEIVDSRKELRCPECRVLVTVSVDELPPNVLLTRILEGMKNATNQQIQQSSNASPAHHQKDVKGNENKISQKTSDTNTSSLPQALVPSTNESGGGVGNVKMKMPHAKAIYDFNSKESGDLNFKKGDIILLKKKIDQNWYIGELNSRTGSFPINHAQIIVPLPVAQCKSLYDFKMKPNEEEGCLAFKKGTVINVLRRVDQNWAEGRIDDAIGIFPISFVEMNSVAKQLMEVSAKNMQLSTSHQHQTSSSAVNTAANIRSVPIPPFETNFNNHNASDSSSTTTTSPNSTPSNTSSSNSSTAPNSPINSQDTENLVVSVQGRASLTTREKRNSLTALINTSSSAGQASNRHSVEILSVPELENALSGVNVVSNQNQKNEVRRPERGHHRSKSGHHNPQQAHIQPYVALYPYKPQKPDELELKKGSVYYVLEKCQDGWFKGVNRQQKSGVFPGNYVAPIRTRNNDSSSGNSHNSNQKGQPIFISRDNFQKTLQPPPDLPPRNNNASPSTGSSLSNWSKTLHMDSLFNRKSTEGPMTTSDHSPNVSLNSSNEHNKSGKDKDKKDSTAMSFVKRLTKRSKSPGTSSTAYSMDNPVFEDSSVPTSSGTNKNIHLSHPVHVRSGSCPSQLLQNIPMDANQGTGPFVYGSQRIKGHKERPSMAHLRNNQDLTISAANNRMRNAQAATNNQPQSSMMSVSATQPPINQNQGNNHHRKSQSLDASSIVGQLAGPDGPIKPSRGATSSAGSSSSNNGPSMERFRCIVPYPPNSEYELELRLNDIVFVMKKRENGWYKGQHQRTRKIGLFPASFVTPDI
uniref:RING-type E3 ubiquitin transferase n=1 Tax=Culicoides sonorensis TaxID=179676 RepID=A0A336MVK6_CULSO